MVHVSPCLDQSIWLSSGNYGILQRVKSEGTNLKVMSKFDIKVCGIAVTPSNQLLLCAKGNKVKHISSLVT
ncbi:Hypothetical predicted protein [Mytilus galloprovincialis]|uniref:Uncharacterized protein n=1 Tax=Mytilus galloprovincialis TaxID=29158 RepID=A0A8B6GGZ3_MYTGA|nr:Hypothetical predicted protein [Mytilus galloprovincialis]